MASDTLPEGFCVMPVAERFDPRFGVWMTQEEWEIAVAELETGKRQDVRSIKEVQSKPKSVPSIPFKRSKP